MYDLSTVAQVAAYVHTGTNNGFVCCFSPDGGTVATGGGNSSAVLHRVRSIEPQLLGKPQSGAVSAAYMYNGRATSAAGKLITTYGSTAEAVASFSSGEDVTHLLEISPDGSMLWWRCHSGMASQPRSIIWRVHRDAPVQEWLQWG